MSAPVFISYSSKDQTTAETICKSLESRGQACWISCRDVHPGENFQEAIVQAMRAARVMVLVFTSNANNSDEIKKELVLAGRHHVTVVPVRVEDVMPSDAFSYELATRQWIDLFKNWEQEIERLSTRISTILQTTRPSEGAAAQLAASPKPSPSARGGGLGWGRSSRRPAVWAGAVIAVLLIGGAALYLHPFSVTSTTADAEEAAWQDAQGKGTPVAYNAYLKAFPQGAHADQAQLRVESLALADASARTNDFDGRWNTTVTCTPAPGTQGYALQFDGEVKDGDYHGHQGTEGQPGWYTLDGRIQPGGSAALFGKGIVALSSVAAGAATGTPYAYHVSAQFQSTAGAGKRMEGRVCSFSFVKK